MHVLIVLSAYSTHSFVRNSFNESFEYFCQIKILPTAIVLSKSKNKTYVLTNLKFYCYHIDSCFLP